MVEHDSIWAEIAKPVGLVAAWFGTMTIADAQAIVAILSGLCVGAYAAMQGYVLWRDKIKRKSGGSTE